MEEKKEDNFYGAVAQVVEQRTENPCVGSSTLPRTTIKKEDLLAQLVEHHTFNVGVMGSNPIGVTNRALMASHWLMDKKD